MSAVEETSNNSMDVKEDAEFDVEAEEDKLDDDYFGDPTRYMFYRYFAALCDAWMFGVASLSSRCVCFWQDILTSWVYYEN